MDKKAKPLRLAKLACIFTLIAAIVSALDIVVCALAGVSVIGPVILLVCMLVIFGCMLWLYQKQKKAGSSDKKS